MINLLIWIGRLAGSVGALLFVAAVIARLLGQWRIGDMSVGTLMQAGTAAMVLGALAYVAVVAERNGG